MTAEASTRLADLVPGQVFIALLDPEEGTLHFRRGWAGNPELVQVEVTVVSNTRLPGTADARYPWRADTHRVAVLHDGRSHTATGCGDIYVSVLALHHPVCSECGELWPCRDNRFDMEARHLVRELDEVCDHCGKPIGYAFVESFFDGVTTRRFHLAKSHRAKGKRCVDALAEAKASMPGEAKP